jgi:hypothetical protein
MLGLSIALPYILYLKELTAEMPGWDAFFHNVGHEL